MIHNILNSIRNGFITYLNILFGISIRISDEVEDYWDDHLWIRVVTRTIFWGIIGLTLFGLILMIWGVFKLLHFDYSNGCWLIFWATICNGLAYVMLGILGKTLHLGILIGLLLKDTLVSAPTEVVRNVSKWIGELIPWTIESGQMLLSYVGAFIPFVKMSRVNQALESMELEAPTMDPVFDKAEKRIKAIIAECVLIGKIINRYFLLNFGVATLVVFLNLLGSELPTPALQSLFIGAGCLFLIAMLVYKKTDNGSYERIAKLTAWIIGFGFALIATEYGTGAFSWGKVHGAQTYAARQHRLEVQWAKTTLVEATYELTGVTSDAYQITNDNGPQVVCDSTGNPALVNGLRLANATVGYYPDEGDKMLIITAQNGDKFVPVCLIANGIRQVDKICAIPLRNAVSLTEPTKPR